MRQFVRDLVIGPDGKPDEQALISIGAALLLFATVIYRVFWLHADLDMTGFAAAVGAIGVQRGLSAYGNAKEASAAPPSS